VRPDHRGEVVLVPGGCQEHWIILGGVGNPRVGLPGAAEEERVVLVWGPSRPGLPGAPGVADLAVPRRKRTQPKSLRRV
jgi:hypothetical protein